MGISSIMRTIWIDNVNKNMYLLVINILGLIVSTQSTANESSEVRWRNLGNGVVLDTTTDYEWTLHNNGHDIDWGAALDYCHSLSLAGGRWLLPDAEDLLAIAVSNPMQDSPYTQEWEGGSGIDAGLAWAWSRDRASNDNDGTKRAWVVSIWNQEKFEWDRSEETPLRAICMRSSERQ